MSVSVVVNCCCWQLLLSLLIASVAYCSRYLCLTGGCLVRSLFIAIVVDCWCCCWLLLLLVFCGVAGYCVCCRWLLLLLAASVVDRYCFCRFLLIAFVVVVGVAVDGCYCCLFLPWLFVGVSSLCNHAFVRVSRPRRYRRNQKLQNASRGQAALRHLAPWQQQR